MNNGAGGVTSLVAGSEITVELATDGTVSGSGGCNSYTGVYDLDGEALTFDGLAATERACVEPAGVMEQEQQFLAALERVATWEHDGVNVTLRDTDARRRSCSRRLEALRARTLLVRSASRARG